jgi:hypothetical protein
VVAPCSPPLAPSPPAPTRLSTSLRRPRPSAQGSQHATAPASPCRTRRASQCAAAPGRARTRSGWATRAWGCFCAPGCSLGAVPALPCSGCGPKRAKRPNTTSPAGALMSGLGLIVVTVLSLATMWGGLDWHQRGVAQRQRAARDARLWARLQGLVAGFVHCLYNHRQRDTWPGRRRRLRLYFYSLD